jgi:hypothetical protein
MTDSTQPAMRGNQKTDAARIVRMAVATTSPSVTYWRAI